jgi:hypothetical protein
MDPANGKEAGNAKKILKQRERTQSSIAAKGVSIFGVLKTNWFSSAKRPN